MELSYVDLLSELLDLSVCFYLLVECICMGEAVRSSCSFVCTSGLSCGSAMGYLATTTYISSCGDGSMSCWDGCYVGVDVSLWQWLLLVVVVMVWLAAVLL